jgi:hypothetical protein
VKRISDRRDRPLLADLTLLPTGRNRPEADPRPLSGVVDPTAKKVTVGRYLALSGRVPHMPPMISHASPTFIHVCVIFDSLPLPSTLPSG